MSRGLSQLQAKGSKQTFPGNDNDNNDSDADFLVSVVDKVSSLASQPTPGLSNLPLGYPLALLTASAVLSVPTALLLNTFFAGYYYVGKYVLFLDDDGDDGVSIDSTVKDDEKDDGDSSVTGSSTTALAALGGAVLSAGLLSPEGLSVAVDETTALGVVALGVASATLVNSSGQGNNDKDEAFEREADSALRQWDQKFIKTQRQQQQQQQQQQAPERRTRRQKQDRDNRNETTPQ